MIKDILLYKTISTDRLELKPLDLTDGSFVFELLNSEGWKKFIGDRNIHNLEDARNYILKIRNLPETIYWIACKKENNTPVGVITLMKRANFDFYDLGFAFLGNHSGKGYAFEASSEVVKVIRQETDLKSLIAITLPDNSKSKQLLERLNMNFEKEIIENKEVLLLYKLNLKTLNTILS